ncbi:hypothetical protein ZIOFF_024335 [Zingiber officinale]|uniref:Amine oxidase domain-containing protein n=1 Tax=Zingiber officinale TaxID=94328 RepID=A0A8J5GS78_ZINOF|nr:hypothetical protein ZIOFF_024335 [Zingiber officinale]
MLTAKLNLTPSLPTKPSSLITRLLLYLSEVATIGTSSSWLIVATIAAIHSSEQLVSPPKETRKQQRASSRNKQSILRASSREMLVFKLSRVLNLLIPFSMISSINLDFSGIAAAHALKNAAFQVVLLESRDRIGGRVHTNYSFGFPVDMGAAWLHGVCNENPLASWIGRLGLPIYRTSGDNSVLYDHDLESYALFDGDGHQVPQDLVEKVGKVEFEGLGELRSKDEEDEGLGELRSKDEEDEGI